jgi:hypothetical protein
VTRAAKPFFIRVVHNPSGAVGHVAAPELSSQEVRAQSRGTRDSTGAHLVKEARSGVEGHVVVPEPTSTGSCDLKLQLTWQRVDARSAPCLDLKLVCGGTRSSGYRLVLVPDLPQPQSLVDRLKNVGGLLTVAVTQYGDLHLQVSTALVTIGSEFRKLRVLGDRGKIWHCVI